MMTKHAPPAFRLREVLYPSNLLTLARLLLLPTALRAMRTPQGRWQALSALGIAMLTDALDGPIARYRNEISSLGKVLDPIADKLMIDSTAITLTRNRGFPWWATAAMLARDVVIMLGGMLVYRRHTRITVANMAGKATTLGLTATLLLYIVDGPRSGRRVLYLTFVPFFASMVAYMRSFVQDMRS